MPFIDSYVNNVLNVAFTKSAGLYAKNTVYLALGNVPVDENNDPVFDTTGTALGFVELSATTGEASNGYSRVMVARRISSGSGNSYVNDSAFPHIGSAADRGIQNDLQINWTKATIDWERVNAFAIASSSEVGETDSIYFVGGLDLTETDKAAGGLLVEAGAVALFDPATFRIEFPAEDVAIA